MVDVAATAGVSRQTLYNEFGSKDGLARALLRRETDAYLHGVERALAVEGGPVDRLAAVTAWTIAAAAPDPLCGPCSPAAGANACPRRAGPGLRVARAGTAARGRGCSASPAELLAWSGTRR